MFKLKQLFTKTEEKKAPVLTLMPHKKATARLVNMRRAKARQSVRPNGANLLARIHRNKGITTRENQGQSSCIKYWTQRNVNDTQSAFLSEPSMQEVALDAVSQEAAVLDILLDAERDWLDAGKDAQADVNSDVFWLNHYQTAKKNAQIEEELGKAA